MKNTTIGILAHVDAGKTTLAEAILYCTGRTRRAGRVDHGDTAMDVHELERRRGITIFMSQAELTLGDWHVTLLDTPGHVDFSSETERVLQVLDYAILVISGIDGVQAHTRTLWRLLAHYRVPTVIFVTKMDFARRGRETLLSELRRELDEGCVDAESGALAEQTALSREDLLERYLETGAVADEDISRALAARQVFPCWFGSGMKIEGVETFLAGLERYLLPRAYPETFGARVFKIGRDPQGNRLTYLKVTGGTLRVRDSVSYGELREKVNQIRLYTGAKYETAEEIGAGGVCAVTGLTATENGQGLGGEAPARPPQLEPVMDYCIVLPAGQDAQVMMQKLRQLAEEDPQLHITYDTRLGEIRVSLMGEVQAEILKSLIEQRFGAAVEIDNGRVLYKETIEDTVEGVGHYEPLRHYAEVHLLLEPLPLGSGLQLAAACSEDMLDRNWQRLILTHLAEKTHRGVLTGAPITDMKITLAAGRAHLKHTEGGDFRQATYRAVRQGLMQAKSKLLEPWYAFRLEVPPEQLGRAISDIRLRHGTVEPPGEAGEMSLLRGRAPVTGMSGYAAEVAAYTGGRGRLALEPDGYDACHDQEAVVAAVAYDPESDLENTPDSVFCAHGGGFTVKWDKVSEYMHLESCLKKEIPYVPQVSRRNLQLDEKELEAIMLREFGPIKRPVYRPPAATSAGEADRAVSTRKSWFIVDGYNVIFAWEDLKKLADQDMAAAREQLMQLLCNFAAFTCYEVVLVFDGYKAPQNRGERFTFHGLHVAYTKEHETADMYIERLVQEIGKNEQVRVVTSDALIQLSAVRSGVLRMSAREFEEEAAAVSREIGEILARQTGTKNRIGDTAVIREEKK
ncbi:MAG: GTP-binding protein [Ruminococcaceae bacterium]|nr:GTP-binding protein [Oscillospiraceae bacterium]